jgi:hypothetical protein
MDLGRVNPRYRSTLNRPLSLRPNTSGKKRLLRVRRRDEEVPGVIAPA